MIGIVEKDKEHEILKNYFDLLSKTGYVKGSIVKRYLLWLFIIDFADMLYPNLREGDYAKIYRALINLFSNGNCLLSYGYTCKYEGSLITNSV